MYELHSKDIHDFIYYKFGNDQSASDRMQDAFIKLWENCKKVTPQKAKGFLLTVANNSMLNEIKHRKVVLQYAKKPVKEYTNETPEFILEKEQFLEQYQKAMGQLTEEQRVAFCLNKIEGMKHKEIAELLGVTRKVVEYRIYSAFMKLKEDLNGVSLK